jgi:hypothetical protein
MNIGFNHYHVDIFAQSFATTGGCSGFYSQFCYYRCSTTITDFDVLHVCKT